MAVLGEGEVGAIEKRHIVRTNSFCGGISSLIRNGISTVKFFFLNLIVVFENMYLNGGLTSFLPK